jgi:hypothetical protein
MLSCVKVMAEGYHTRVPDTYARARVCYEEAVARPTFDPHWSRLGMPGDTYPPARFWLAPFAADALDDCVEVQDARERDEDGELFARGLACPRIFGAPDPRARRPAERDRRFGRVRLRAPVAHPLRGPLDALRVLPVLPAGLRPEDAQGRPHALTQRYARVLRANTALGQADYPNAFREAYAELRAAVHELFVGAEGSLLCALGATPGARWERLLRLGEQAAGASFDPVWADDEDTHLTLACLAALGFAVVQR